MELVKKILSSSLLLLISNSVGRLAMFLANIFAARMLSQDAFGQFAMIRNTISSVEGLNSGTLGSTIIKKVAETNHSEKEKLPTLLTTIFIINFIISLILMLAIFFNIDFIVDKFFIGSSEIVQGLYIGIFILISSSFATLTQNILIGFEEYKKLSIMSIITSVVSIPTIFILIYYFKLNGALFGIVFYFSLDFILKFLYYKKLSLEFIFNFKDFKLEATKILLFSYPLFLAVIINTISFWYARVLLVNKTNSFEEIAIFDAAFQWLTIIMIITSSTTNVALPMLNKVIENTKDLANIFKINLFINIVISILIASIFIIFSKYIMSIYGKVYVAGFKTLEVLSATAIFFTIATIYNRYMISIHKTWLLFFAASIGSLSMFALLLYNEKLSSLILSYAFLSYYLSGSILYVIMYFIVNYKKREQR